MLQPKDTGLLNGYKNKTHIYAVCKRPTSDLFLSGRIIANFSICFAYVYSVVTTGVSCAIDI